MGWRVVRTPQSPLERSVQPACACRRQADARRLRACCRRARSRLPAQSRTQRALLPRSQQLLAAFRAALTARAFPPRPPVAASALPARDVIAGRGGQEAQRNGLQGLTRRQKTQRRPAARHKAEQIRGAGAREAPEAVGVGEFWLKT